MQHGFIKVGAAVPLVSVADPTYNVEQLIALAHRAYEEGAEVTVFPELCITGYTCGDLFTQQTLLQESEEAIARFAEATKVRYSSGVISGYTGGFSGRYPTHFLAFIGSSEISKPLIFTEPDVGARHPVIIFIVVDFPAPLGPKSP